MFVTQIIKCKPITKGRPRVSMRGGIPRTYTPKTTVHFEKFIADKWQHPIFQENIPLRMNINIYFKIPKSWSKKRKEDHFSRFKTEIPKGDVDNFAKSILDGLNGVAYIDDKQIVDLHITKSYNDVLEGIVIQLTNDFNY